MEDNKQVYQFVWKKIQMLINGQDMGEKKLPPSSRATLAKLRRGIGKAPGSIPDIWEITLGELPEEWHSVKGVPTYAENAVHAALTLYALHQQGKDRSMSVNGKDDDGKYIGDSFGAAVGKLINGDNENAIKRRFDAAATAADFSEFAHHARGLIQLLKAAEIPLDYPRFAQDLFDYQLPNGANGVRLRWGEDFYRALHRKDTSTENKGSAD
jgi:CRISPR system Cascade subunit CasB